MMCVYVFPSHEWHGTCPSQHTDTVGYVPYHTGCVHWVPALFRSIFAGDL
jgi:hypothetical protein